MVGTFLIFVCLIMAVVLAYGAYKLGSVKKLNEHVKTNEGRGVVGSMLLGAGVAAGAAIILMVMSLEAKGDWFEWTEIYAGADYTFKTSPQCVTGDKVDEHITSNLGLRQNFYTNDRAELNGLYTHHSCFIGVDNLQYDAVGVQAVYRVDW